MDKNSTRSPRFIDANLVFPWYVEAFHEFSPHDVRFSMLDILSNLDNIPAADVLPRDEAIKMGAELAAMHGSDATSQQLEEAFLKGVEDGMTRRDVRPVVRGKWERMSDNDVFGDIHCKCSACGEDWWQGPGWFRKANFCPNCGSEMREES